MSGEIMVLKLFQIVMFRFDMNILHLLVFCIAVCFR